MVLAQHGAASEVQMQRPFNFQHWVDVNQDLLKPPVGNKSLFDEGGMIVQVVSGGFGMPWTCCTMRIAPLPKWRGESASRARAISRQTSGA
jgi:3-hydroxyanthranilic acid dioxygenase